ncbi:MAG: YgiT-type zinc finger protein [Eubacteriales bacterium]
MKCKACKKRMQSVLASYEFNWNGKIMRAITVPAERCPECGKIEILDLIKANVNRYACDCAETTIDYTKYEESEAVNITATQMLL